MLNGYPSFIENNITYPETIICCKSNPVNECTCTENGFPYSCIDGLVSDKSDNLVTVDIPVSMINKSIQSLPNSNMTTHLIAGAAALGILYFITRKK